MNPSSRMRVSTTWLRVIAPSRLVHGESADGARASPAISAHSARVNVLAGLAEEVARHRLDAVDAGAEIDAIQVQLEDLRLGQLRIDHQGEDGLAGLPPVRLLVREEQRPRQLLGQRAAPLHGPRRAQVADDGAAERDRVDARVLEEAMVLDRHERVLEVGRDVGEGDVEPVLVHPEPPRPVRRQEPRVPHPAPQLVHGPRLAQGPGERDGGQHHEDAEDRGGDPVAHAPGDGRPAHQRVRLACRTNDSTV